MVVNTPVDSTTYWAPASPHLMLVGSLLETSGGSERTARLKVSTRTVSQLTRGKR